MRIAAPDCLTQSMQPFLRLELRRGRDAKLEFETLGGVHPRRQHVVAVAGPGHGAALDRAAMLLEGHHVGHHLAGMRAPRQPVDHRDRGVLGQFLHQRMVEGADDDAVDVARQHAGGVGDGLAAAELHLGAGQRDQLAAELPDADVERHPRPGRGLVEDHGDGLAGERLSPRGCPSSHGCSSMIPRSSAGGTSIRSRKWRMPCRSPGRSLLARAPAARARRRRRPGRAARWPRPPRSR